ncbi:MAG: L-lactate permease [Clostridiales Family XIII bacterium]|jgi:lactate permease|nr:L-lactate permease [Clostridiales Family XIII bacterium]
MLLALMAVSPILILLILLLVFKMSAMRSSIVSFFVALVIFFFYYKPGFQGLGISLLKGISLALFVILIIWGAMFLYNLVNETGALHVINTNIGRIVSDRFFQFILLSWIFSAFLQGIAGFGVPVIVVTPLLIGMGFDPIISVAAVLVGHSWAFSFGSMGSSIYAINMVTNTDIGEIIIYMAVFGAVAMFCTGLSVCYIYGGKSVLLRKSPYVLILSIVMSAVLYVLARLEMLSVIGILTGLCGLICCYGLYRVLQRKKGTGKIQFFKTELNLFQALLPYLLIIVLSVLFYFLNPQWIIGLDFDGYVTALGHQVIAEENYVTFNLLKFPFSVIMLSSFISMIVYAKKKILNKEKMKKIVKVTAKKCMSTTVTLLFLLSIAVLMMDSGMIDQIANSLVSLTGRIYPLVAPFIGLLGAFVTGSNTNSNVIFGSLQEIAALALGFPAAVMCGAQSIGASIGGGIGPTTVSLGATAAQIQGEENKIYKKTLGPILITTAVLAIVNIVINYGFQ